MNSADESLLPFDLSEDHEMKRLALSVAAMLMTIGSITALYAQEAADTILLNGKIVTVDDYFSIQEAIAIQGERIAAVGSNEAIRALSGPDTRTIDLGGRTVIPGLIDNHNHVIRATEYWPNEARLDGVTSRVEALALLEAKADALPEGEWLMSLGGWTENQFVDDTSDFTLAELDEIAPARPAFIQSVYDHAYGNTTWFDEMDIPLTATDEQRTDAIGLAAHVVRDETGRATGRLNGGISMVNLAIQRFPEVSAERQAEAIKTAFSHLNSIGLTSVYDPAGVGIRKESYARIRALADEVGLTVRIFHTLGGGVPATPEEARAVVDEIVAARPFQGNNLESCYLKELFAAMLNGKPSLNVLSERRKAHEGDGTTDARYQSEVGAVGLQVDVAGSSKVRHSVSTKDGHHILITFAGSGAPRVFLRQEPEDLIALAQ